MPPHLTNTQIDAFLFDMDGTILTSIAAAERVWTAWAIRHGIDVAAFLPTIHGVQAVETIRRLGLDGVDPDAEAAAILQSEIDDVEGVAAIAGAGAFLATLPPRGWAIVTSAPRRLALCRIAAAGLPVPEVLIAAEDVARGKPAPDCFLLAAERLGVDIARCLVFEDSAAGIAAAAAAGADVMVVTAAGHAPRDIAYRSVSDYAGLSIALAEAGGMMLIEKRSWPG